MAILAMPHHGQDARGTSLVPWPSRPCPITGGTPVAHFAAALAGGTCRPQGRRYIYAARTALYPHASVCTSTESTAGRSRTMGAQLSPASAEAYTCPPVVPKYTPQESSWSTAIASRSTLT